MSLEATIWAWKRAPKLKPASRVVLLRIADEVRQPSKCPKWISPDLRGRVAWPNQSTLADKTGYSERQVRRALVDLEERELIARYPRWRQDGTGRTSDLIEVFGPGFCGSKPDTDGRNATEANRTFSTGIPDISAQQTGHLRGGIPDTHAGEPTREPTSEPTEEEPPSASLPKENDNRNNNRARTGLRRPRFSDAFTADPDHYPDDVTEGASHGT